MENVQAGFFFISCFRDEKWMRDFEGDEGDEGGIAAAVPVLLVGALWNKMWVVGLWCGYRMAKGVCAYACRYGFRVQGLTDGW